MTESPFAIPAAPRRNRVLPICIATGAIVVLLLLMLVAMHTAYEDSDAYRYHTWPAAGTEQPFPENPPLRVNAVVALTCDENNRAHLDQRMLVDAKSAYGTKVMPDWYIQFYVAYDQNESDQCEARWAALRSKDVSVVTLKQGDDNNWTLVGSGLSFDGLASFSVPKNSSRIALLLITITDLPQGPQVMYGSNGLPAPPRGFMS